MDTKVHDILIFMSVVDKGNFTAAGRMFGLSRSAAGKAVSRLEDRYGARLLNRTTRAVSITEAGQRLYQHGAALKAAIAAADADMTGGLGQPSGTLRIAAPDAVGRRLVMPVVRAFQADWPDICVEVSLSDTVARIVEDGFDVAVRIGVTSPDTSLIARTLMRDRPILCAAPSYLAKCPAPRNVEQLSTHAVLQFSSVGQRQVWTLEEPSTFWSNAPGRVRLRLNSAEALREAAREGMGIAFLPRVVVADDLQSGHLVEVLPDVHREAVPIMALYPHKRFLEPRVRIFIDMLAEHLSKDHRFTMQKN